MKAVLIKEFGEPENLEIGDWPDPVPSEEEILLKVEATALNRADTLQRKGLYPVPEGESPILGLEVAGMVANIGAKVTKWKVGDRICGLIGGGGYAEYTTIHEDMAMPIPPNLSFEEAAGIPEVFLTAFQAMKWIGKLQEGETILIHAGASGVGTAALQLADIIGAKSIVTASAGKHDICRKLGAMAAIDYKSEDFEAEVRRITLDQGVDMVLDFIGGPYFQKNLNVLRIDGRLVILAFMGGGKVEQVQVANILRKRLQVTGSTLRSRDLAYKISLTRDLQDFAWDHFTSGRLKPVIDRVFQLKDVVEAHRFMEANMNKGKIVLKI